MTFFAWLFTVFFIIIGKIVVLQSCAALFWSEIAYKIDPELSAPVKQYEFDNGNRIFYKPKKRIKYGNRKSGH